MPKNVELPSEVAKECFLFEAINYLVCGCPPVESFDHDGYDFRSCEYLYCGEYDTGIKEDILLTNELISEQYNIEMNPQYDIKYQDVNFHYDINEYDKHYTNKIDTFPELSRQRIVSERPLILEYIEKQNGYNEKIEKITLPWYSKLLQELRSGNIVGNGFLVQKYSETENEFVDIYEDWYSRAMVREINHVTGKYDIKYEDKQNKIDRVSIPKEHWIDDNIDCENSSLEFSIGKDRYKYLFILIDFENVYRIFPRQIENDIVARLIGNKIIYNNNEYLLNNITTKGRKSLDWDLFYVELIRYIIQDCNGSLPNKQYVLIDKMQEWCKANLKGGSYGSLQTRISKIYDTLKNQK